MTPVFRTLEERGFIAQLSDESLPELLSNARYTVYAGFDPTADSLHLGHLVPPRTSATWRLLLLCWLRRLSLRFWRRATRPNSSSS
jgi:hypothetical protein